MASALSHIERRNGIYNKRFNQDRLLRQAGWRKHLCNNSPSFTNLLANNGNGSSVDYFYSSRIEKSKPSRQKKLNKPLAAGQGYGLDGSALVFLILATRYENNKPHGSVQANNFTEK